MCLTPLSPQLIELSSTLQGKNCPGDTVIYSCETNGSFLTWIVEPLIRENGAQSFFSNNQPGSVFDTPMAARRELIATTPHLLSNMTFSPSNDLVNTTVICRTNNDKSATHDYKLSGMQYYTCVAIHAWCNATYVQCQTHVS